METTLSGIEKELRALHRSDIKTWLRTGELLAEAQRLCGPDRDFATWLRTNEIARTTAYKAISAWRLFGSVPTPGHFTREAMDLLSRDEAARNKAVELSVTQRITARVARMLLREHMQPTAKPSALEEAVAAERKHVVIGDGFKVTFTFDNPPTDADLLGAISHAGREIQNRMRARRAA